MNRNNVSFQNFRRIFLNSKKLGSLDSQIGVEICTSSDRFLLIKLHCQDLVSVACK